MSFAFLPCIEIEFHYGNGLNPYFTVNGERFDCDRNLGGCRFKVICEKWNVILKADSSFVHWQDGEQSQTYVEAKVWETLPDEDRDYFAPILAYGKTDQGEATHGRFWWSVQELLDFDPEMNGYQDNYWETFEYQFMRMIAETYEDKDFCSVQYKILRDGRCVFHDYGMSSTESFKRVA